MASDAELRSKFETWWRNASNVGKKRICEEARLSPVVPSFVRSDISEEDWNKLFEVWRPK